MEYDSDKEKYSIFAFSQIMIIFALENVNVNKLGDQHNFIKNETRICISRTGITVSRHGKDAV